MVGTIFIKNVVHKAKHDEANANVSMEDKKKKKCTQIKSWTENE